MRASAKRLLVALGVLIAASAWWFARPAAPEAQGHGAMPVLLGATDPRTTIDFTLVLRLPGDLTDDDDLMLVTNNGKIIRLRMKDIRVIGRNTQGVHLIGLDEGERVVSLARLAEKEEEDGEDGE